MAHLQKILTTSPYSDHSLDYALSLSPTTHTSSWPLILTSSVPNRTPARPVIPTPTPTLPPTELGYFLRL